MSGCKRGSSRCLWGRTTGVQMAGMEKIWLPCTLHGTCPKFSCVTLQEMDTSEVERNAQLGIQHAERLAAHGYRQVCISGLDHTPIWDYTIGPSGVVLTRTACFTALECMRLEGIIDIVKKCPMHVTDLCILCTQVPGLPGYVLEPHDRGLQSPGSGDPNEVRPEPSVACTRSHHSGLL